MTLFTLQNVNLMSHHRGTGLDEVKSNFVRYGLLDGQVVFLKGYFSETLSMAPIEKLALMRLDGDTFESTRDVLQLLYKKLSPGDSVLLTTITVLPTARKPSMNFAGNTESLRN